MLGMPEIRRSDYHRIEVLFLVEHVLVVNIGVVLVAILFKQARDFLLIIFRPDIANGLEAKAGDLQTGIYQDLSLSACSRAATPARESMRSSARRGGPPSTRT